MDSNLLWQYLAVLALIIFALWKMIHNIVKRNGKLKKGGSCCGCALADSCRDYKKPESRRQKTQMTGMSSTSKSSCCESEKKNYCHR